MELYSIEILFLAAWSINVLLSSSEKPPQKTGLFVRSQQPAPEAEKAGLLLSDPVFLLGKRHAHSSGENTPSHTHVWLKNPSTSMAMLAVSLREG